MGITEFIAARLAEDEAEANPAVCGCLDANHIPYCVSKPHLERPRRELAAKRAIMARHKVNAEPEVWGDSAAREMRGKPTGYTTYWCSECDYGHIGGRLEGCPTVRALATVWSDHPDYRAEWKP